MKKVYIVTYRSSEKLTAKVVASDENEAKKAAFAAYTYRGSMWYPNPKIDSVVEKVELDPDQIVNGVFVQPAVQVECGVSVCGDILNEQFAKKEG